MLFVALGKTKPTTHKERIARRMDWQMPDVGAEVLGEYWLETLDPALVVVFKADHMGQIWAGLGAWHDLFEISVYPAVTAEEGLDMLKQMPPAQSAAGARPAARQGPALSGLTLTVGLPR